LIHACKSVTIAKVSSELALRDEAKCAVEDTRVGLSSATGTCPMGDVTVVHGGVWTVASVQPSGYTIGFFKASVLQTVYGLRADGFILVKTLDANNLTLVDSGKSQTQKNNEEHLFHGCRDLGEMK